MWGGERTISNLSGGCPTNVVLGLARSMGVALFSGWGGGIVSGRPTSHTRSLGGEPKSTQLMSGRPTS